MKAARFLFSVLTMVLAFSFCNAPGAEEVARHRERAPRVILFERPNFRGESIELELGGGIENLADVRFGNGTKANDKVSSIVVEPGAAVRIYVDAKSRGESLLLTRSTDNLAELKRGGGATWDETISSLRVEENRYGRGRGGRDPSREPRIIVFRAIQFGGESLEIFPGEKFTSLKDARFDDGGRVVNDEISSIRIIGPVRVRVFNESRFRGTPLEITADAIDLTKVRRPDGRGSWNDCISSLEVERIDGIDGRGGN